MGILYGVFIGETLISVGFGLLAANLLNFIQAFYLLVNRSLNESFTKFLKVLIFPMIISGVLAAALSVFSLINIESDVFSLILKSLISLVIFVILLFISKENKEFFKEYIGKTLFKRNAKSDTNKLK